jgi:hypothetical protein
MSKILVQIDTFIQSKESEEITIECINRIKNLGLPILLTSHLEIPEYISSMCDYCEVDLNNTLLEPDGSVSFLTFDTNSFSTSITLTNPDPHAPACLTSLINGARFSKNNGFDFFIRFEYDSIINFEYIGQLKELIKIGSMCKGFVFTSKNWIDGKIIMVKSEDYINLFDKQINTGDDYIRFTLDEEIPVHDQRHLQCVQYQVLEKYILNLMVQIPTFILVNKFLDNNIIKTKEVGIFRPAFINNESNKFAIICHAFDRSLDFNFQIISNGISKLVTHSFISNNITYKIFEIEPETLYEIIYINPITSGVEKWEFSTPDVLKNIAKLELK